MEREDEKHLKKFGINKFSEEEKNFLKKFNTLSWYIKREILLGNKDFIKFKKSYKEKSKFYLYGGRGPSNENHIGHFFYWKIFKDFQKEFDLDLIFQITDDEKYLSKNDELKEYWKKNEKNIESILEDLYSVGINFKKLKIIINTKHIGKFYKKILKISKNLNFSNVKKTFGLKEKENIGKFFFPSLQILPTCLDKKKTAIIICGIDQDPYFRLNRDISKKIGFNKPIIIYKKLFPSLKKFKDRMSSRKKDTAIFLSEKEIEFSKKIKKMFSGGKITKKLHKKLGGNTKICSVYRFLKFGLEENEKKLKEIKEKYESGKILTNELKKYLLEKMKKFFLEKNKKILEFRKNKKKILEKIFF